MRRSCLVLVALAATGCYGPGSHAGIGIATTAGGAYVPADVSSGTTTSLVYRENGGVVTRVLDSPEQLAAKARQFDALLDTLESSAIPVDFHLEIPVRSLGGDTSGYMSSPTFRSNPRTLGPFPLVQMSIGFGLGKLSFHDRTRTQLVGDGMTFSAAEQTVDTVTFDYIGFPVRMTAALGDFGLTMHVQADLNLQTLTDSSFGDEGQKVDPSPLHWGLGYRRGPIRLIGDLAFGRFREFPASSPRPVPSSPRSSPRSLPSELQKAP